MSTFRLDVVSATSKIMSKDVEFIVVRTTEGDLGILPNHTPIVAEISAGELKITSNGEVEDFFVMNGFIEVSNNQVTIIAEESMRVDEIDVVLERKKAEKIKAKLAALQEEQEIMIAEKHLRETIQKIKSGERR